MNVGNVLSDLIRGNPFATPVGSLVEEATEDFIGGELWQLFSGVCQAINQSATGPKDAVRAIRRRFVDTVQSNEITSYHTLLLLETCVLNCGYRFIVVLATREALKDFGRFATNGIASISDRVRQKLLSLLQAWALKFGNQIDFREFSNIYMELKSQGVQFPDNEPTHEPDRRMTSVSSSESAVHLPAVSHASSISSHESPTRLQSTIPKTTKLSTDLAQVRMNVCVLSDLISDAETSNTTIDEETKLLMTDIVESLQQMSQRLMQAISAWESYQETLPNRGANNSILLDMLNVNDELHTVLLRYDRWRQVSQIPISETAHANSDDDFSDGGVKATAAFDLFVGEPSDSSNIALPNPNEDNCSVNARSPTTEQKSDDDRTLIEF